MNKEEQIGKYIYDKLSYIYCNNCRFSGNERNEAIDEAGYDGCDDCHRKMMGWEVSKYFTNKLAKDINLIIGE